MSDPGTSENDATMDSAHDAWMEEQQEAFMACPAARGGACECGWHPKGRA